MIHARPKRTDPVGPVPIFFARVPPFSRTARHRSFGKRFHQLQFCLKFCGQKAIVGIKENEEVAYSVSDAEVAGGSRAPKASLLIQPSNTRVASDGGIGDKRAPVRGTVVDEKKLPARDGLHLDACDSFAKERSRITIRSNN